MVHSWVIDLSFFISWPAYRALLLIDAQWFLRSFTDHRSTLRSRDGNWTLTHFFWHFLQISRRHTIFTLLRSLGVHSLEGFFVHLFQFFQWNCLSWHSHRILVLLYVLTQCLYSLVLLNHRLQRFSVLDKHSDFFSLLWDLTSSCQPGHCISHHIWLLREWGLRTCASCFLLQSLFRFLLGNAFLSQLIILIVKGNVRVDEERVGSLLYFTCICANFKRLPITGECPVFFGIEASHKLPFIFAIADFRHSVHGTDSVSISTGNFVALLQHFHF